MKPFMRLIIQACPEGLLWRMLWAVCSGVTLYAICVWTMSRQQGAMKATSISHREQTSTWACAWEAAYCAADNYRDKHACNFCAGVSLYVRQLT